MTTTGTPTAAQQLAAARAADVVPNVLGATSKIRKQSKRIAWCALSAITPHAIFFLGMHGDLGTPLTTAFSFITAALVCITVDLGIVTMLGVVQTAGIKKAARWTALAVLILLMLISGTVQIMAPGFGLTRFLLGTTVLILVLVEIVAALIDVDPKLLVQIETEAAAIAPPAPTTPAGRKCSPACTCGKHVPRAPRVKKAPPASKTPAKRTPRVKTAPAASTASGILIPTPAQVKALIGN